MKRVLDVGNCAPDHSSIKRFLAKHFECEVLQAHGADDALTALRGGHVDLVLVNRKLEGAVIHDAEAAAARAVRMVKAGAIETVSGRLLETPIDSICVHSDTPTAVAIASRVRRGLEDSGVVVRAFSAA